MLRRVASLLLMLLAFPALALAQEMRVYLVTIGPGEVVYERFGHNELMFVDPSAGLSVTYDWGRFDFNQPNFIGRFILGEMLYSSGTDDARATLEFYQRIGRRVEIQQLNLTPEQAKALLLACQRSHLPENRQYRYDYFVGNCSTEIRDLLDEALGGQIESQLSGHTVETTFRRETNRHMAPNWPLWFGVHMALGPASDRRISAWEQAFLPDGLRDWLQQVQIVDAEGLPAPLALRPDRRTPGTFSPVPPDPPTRWWQTGLIGLAWAGAIMATAQLQRSLPSRAVSALWYLFAGLAGGILLFFWSLTGHWASHANQNLLLLSPLGLILAITVLTRRLDWLTWYIAAAALCLCLVGTAVHFVPGLGQENLDFIVLALPTNAAAAWAAGMRWRAIKPVAAPAPASA